MKLTKSQRVTAIQEIALRLENEDWTNIDLVLKQFSLPTSDSWSNDRRSYVVKMIEDAKDSDLLDLSEHFGMLVPNPHKEPDAIPNPSCWIDGKLKVFISHLSKERKTAADLQSEMLKFGMSCFVAHNDIHPTSEWQVEIEAALTTCNLLVAMIHPNFIESPWCDQEIGFALGRGIPVFTVRFGADPHGFVSRFQAFNSTGKSTYQIANELFDSAIAHKKLQNKMASILVDMFVNSGSFAAAKQRIGYLENLKVWDDSFSLRIEKATRDNIQIKDSWGVPKQVEALIKKWER